MVYNVYSVFDRVANKFGNPFVAVSNNVALRDFKVGMSSMNSLIKNDYALVKIGHWSDENGVISSENFTIISGSMDLVEVDANKDDDSQIDNLKEMLKDE